jgi:hypothetical protein
MKHLIIEGLTGAGKSSLIAELKNILPAEQWQMIYEDETLGELLSELEDKETTNYQKCYRLRQVLTKVDGNANHSYLLERFHPSYYALIPDWELFKEMDRWLAEKNFVLVMLYYDDSLLEERAMRHCDGKDDGYDNAVAYWGSKEKAIEAYKKSQDNRLECLGLTKMHYLKIDTSGREWPKYAREMIKHIL